MSLSIYGHYFSVRLRSRDFINSLFLLLCLNDSSINFKILQFSHGRLTPSLMFLLELLSGIRKEVEIGRLPLTTAEGMEELYHNYKNAVNKRSPD